MTASIMRATGVLLCMSTQLSAAADLAVDITGTSIEQLMNIPVTTVSRQESELQTTPAAVYVLNRNDLRRSRVTNVPDALRLVPGVQVASIDANKWAITIRGFNGRTANKILVLVDGRTVYDPLFGGVFWEARDVPIDEIERIEVIRGPGGTLWGTNAVNGVINIITRSTRETLGISAFAGAGTEERGMGHVRYGWQFGDDAHARVYFGRFERDTGYLPDQAHDDSRMDRGGFRVDLGLGTAGELMLKGDAYDGSFGTSNMGGGYQDLGHSGQNFVARWRYGYASGAQQLLEFWYDHLEFDDVNLGEERDTYDLEYQYALPERGIHRFIWGAGYRTTTDEIRNGPLLTISPSSKRDDLFSLFGQDEISLVERAVRLTFGVKLEHNDYTGTEWQPSARVAWVPDADRTAWAAISRAVRTPSRLEIDLDAAPLVVGNRDIDSEKVVAYEIGYRSRVARHAWADAALFYNDYRDLLSLEGIVLGNGTEGATAGIELAVRWDPHPAWRVDVAYTSLHMDLNSTEQSQDTQTPTFTEDNDPRHQGVVRSAWVVSPTVDVQGVLRYVHRVKAQNVPSYLVADLAVGWRVRYDVELAVSARNLLDDHHPEQSSPVTTEVERSVFAMVRWER